MYRHVYATNVVKYFYSTVTPCCATYYGSSLWVKNDHSGVLVLIAVAEAAAGSDVKSVIGG
jgi:hypothetical protein